VLLAAAATLALPLHVRGETLRRWYVDAAVGRSGDGESWATAWKRPSDIAWSAVAPGDTIYFSGGAETRVYAEGLDITRSGASDLPITVAAATDPGHDGEVVFDFGASDERLRVRNCSHVVVSGFTLRNGTSGSVVWLDGLRGGVTFRDNVIETGPGRNNRNARGINIQGCSNEFGVNLVLGNRISTPDDTTAQTDGIYSMDNGHDALRIEGNAVFVNNLDDSGHSDCFQSYRDGSMAIVDNLFQGSTQGRNNHPVWIADILDGGHFEIRGNRCVNRNGGFNLTVWRSEAGAGMGVASIVGNEIHGGRRALNFERNSGIEIYENIVEPDPEGFAYFMALDALQPSNVEGNQVVADGNVASVLGEVKSWQDWQRDGYDANGQLAERYAVEEHDDAA
jgi:hypothetical protein